MAAMMGMAAMGGLSLAGGFMASRSARREMRRMRRHMEDRLEFAKERWNHFRDTYSDVEQQMVHDAMHGVQGDYQGVTERARADVEGAFSRERDSRRRQMQGMGLDPSSGRYQSSDREMGINQATSTAMAENQARTRERERAETETRQGRMQIGQFGSQQISGAGRDVMQAQTALGQVHGQRANQKMEMAGNLFATAGQMGGMAMMQGGGGGNPGGATDPNPDFNYDAGSGMSMDYQYQPPSNQPQFNHNAGMNTNQFSMRG